jgi:putative redox protein
MKHTVKTIHRKNMSFESIFDKHTVIIDAQPEHGGNDEGPSPKKLLLSALAGCTGMDVVGILQKMRVEFSDFSIDVEAEMTEEHPKHYKSFHILYHLKGKNIDIEKVKKAVELSQERYCGVSYMFGKFAQITHHIEITES